MIYAFLALGVIVFGWAFFWATFWPDSFERTFAGPEVWR